MNYIDELNEKLGRFLQCVWESRKCVGVF